MGLPGALAFWLTRYLGADMEVVIGILIGLVGVSVIGAFGALYLAIKTQIDLKAMQKSTHNIQYVPVDTIVGSDKQLNDELQEAEDQYADEFDDINALDELDRMGTPIT